MSLHEGMAELLSVHIHVPITKVSVNYKEGRKDSFTRDSQQTNGHVANKLPGANGRSGSDPLLAPSRFSHVSKRKAVDIEFKDMVYQVKNGKGKFSII